MKYALLFFAAGIIASSSFAQNGQYDKKNPPAAGEQIYEAQLRENIQERFRQIDWSNTQRATSGSVLFTIPVVVHVVHNYGVELISDNAVYQLIDSINSYFLKTRPDTADIIDKFKPVAANTQIALRLATLDPDGDPTKGIDHIYSYLTSPGSYDMLNQLKMHQWPQSKYLNIWIMNGLVVTGYSFPGSSWSPFDASYYPYYDGIILPYYSIVGSFPARLLAKYLYLPACCGFGSTCLDNDGIPDTPPCWVDYPTDCTHLYDTTCDTPNRQNIMYGSHACSNMFTYGQGQYMQYILQIDIGSRDSLVIPENYTATGMDRPRPDLRPVADFNLQGFSAPTQKYQRFFCLGHHSITFRNYSWNDTITSASWVFTNDADTPVSTNMNSVGNKFHMPGWVTVSLSVTGNNSGTTTLSDAYALYIADSAAISANGYTEEFLPERGIDRWPTFNYYKNGFAWQRANTGYFDNACMEYTGYDARTFPNNMTGSPCGDMDDMYGPVLDLSSFTGDCFLNFMSSGATATSVPAMMNDSLEITYSIDFARTWVKVKVLKQTELDNKGTVITPYVPAGKDDWVAHSIPLPAAARTKNTIFRFRYYPCGDTSGASTGNNFYLDHVNINSFPESAGVLEKEGENVMIMPNPSHGRATIAISGGVNQALILVYDVTGRCVYNGKHELSNGATELPLPDDVVNAKGLYMVRVITDHFDETKKLIIY